MTDTPNLSPQHPERNTLFDVAIAGAGIGGACAAIALAQRGFKTLLLESGTFPRHKVCGEFLSPESHQTFARIGVLDKIILAGAIPVSEASIVTRGGAAQAPIAPAALSISRWALDPILWQAAQDAGATTYQSTLVRTFRPEAKEWRIETSRGEFRARAVIAATGRRALKWADSALTERDERSLYVGFKAHFFDSEVPPGLIELHASRGGYCGLSRVEDGRTNACLLARYDAVNHRAPAEFWRELLDQLPALRARMQNARPAMEWMATGNVSFERFAPLHSVADEAGNQSKVLCCGDASGYIHPLTGDGMAMAARGGELAAACLASQLRGELNADEASELYQGAWHREFDRRLRWSSFFQQALIEPRIAAPVLSLLNAVPPLARQAVRLTRGS